MVECELEECREEVHPSVSEEIPLWQLGVHCDQEAKEPVLLLRVLCGRLVQFNDVLVDERLKLEPELLESGGKRFARVFQLLLVSSCYLAELLLIRDLCDVHFLYK